jgi:hypothetical protein
MQVILTLTGSAFEKKGSGKVENNRYWPWTVVMDILSFFKSGCHLGKYFIFLFPIQLK